MIDWMPYASALVVGLLGGGHCIGMCGGIVGALGAGHGSRSHLDQLPLLLAYNLGRLASYALAGALVGGLGFLLAEQLPIQKTQQGLLLVAGLFMVLLGLYLGGWLRWLNYLERAGGGLWRRIEPLGRRLLPVRHPGQALLVGGLWGWVPCGLVYTMLANALAAGGALPGAGLMLAFGLGTLPNLLLMGVLAGAAARLVRSPRVRQLAGVTVIAFGLVTLWRALGI